MKQVKAIEPAAVLETVKTASTTAMDGVQDAALKARDYAVEHKAITVAGVVAIGALAFGAYALTRRNRNS